MPFDVTTLNRDPDLVAVLVHAGDVFSFRVRQIVIPPACAALVWETGPQPRLARSGSIVESEGVRELLFVRTTPFAVQARATKLDSRDGYEFSAAAQASVQIIAERTELISFRTAILGSDNRVGADSLQRHCEDVLRAAISDFVSSNDASTLLGTAAVGQFEPVLAERFRPLGFESGLMLAGEMRLTLESPDHARAKHVEQTAAARRKQAESEDRLRAAANESRARHLQDLTAILEQARGLATKTNASLIEIVKTYDPARRGALYEGLATTNRSAAKTTIFVAAGGEVVAFDPSSPQAPTARLDLASEVGPLRSLRLSAAAGQAELLVGAKSGVHVVNLGDSPTLQQTCALAEPPPLRHGFNAAVLLSEHLYATHSEIGLVKWKLAEPAKHEQCLGDVTSGPPQDAQSAPAISRCHTGQGPRSANTRTVRDVQVDDAGRLWFSAGNRVIAWTPGTDAAPSILTAPAMVNAVVVASDLVYAGLGDGSIVAWPTGGPGEIRSIRGTGRPINSLAWLAGGGAPRLLIADGRPRLDLQVIGDTYRVEYRCRQDIRWGFADADWIVGVNSAQDRLIIWRIDAPEEPAAEISVGRLCGHSVQDVVL
jgi:hypothetical protein